MATVPILPDRQAADRLAAYGGAVRTRRWQSLAVLVVLLVLALVSAWVAEVRPATLFANLFRFTSYLGRIMPALSLDHLGRDLADWYWGLGRWLRRRKQQS